MYRCMYMYSAKNHSTSYMYMYICTVPALPATGTWPASTKLYQLLTSRCQLLSSGCQLLSSGCQLIIKIRQYQNIPGICTSCCTSCFSCCTCTYVCAVQQLHQLYQLSTAALYCNFSWLSYRLIKSCDASTRNRVVQWSDWKLPYQQFASCRILWTILICKIWPLTNW